MTSLLSIVVTNVMEHCDEKTMDNCDDERHGHCEDKFYRILGSHGFGALL